MTEAQAEPAEDPMVARRLDTLTTKCRTDHVLAMQLLPFIEGAEWKHDGDGTVTGTLTVDGAPTRVCSVSRTMIEIGRADFPERKRIPVT